MTRPVAFVTGASRGIGKAIALELAAEGYDVAVAARTMVDGTQTLDSGASVPGGLDTTLADVEAAGVDGLAVTMDLLDRASIDKAIDATVDRFGRLDVVVNNAIYQGSGGTALFEDLVEEEQYKLFEGNVHAQLHIIRKVLPHLKATGGGTIVNMISATAYTDPPAPSGQGGWGVAYAMTKAALWRVAPILHVELGDTGLRVFSVDPGFVVTERLKAANKADEYGEHFQGASPDVIGKAVRWLVSSPDADELRGQVVYAQREVKRRQL